MIDAIYGATIIAWKILFFLFTLGVINRVVHRIIATFKGEMKKPKKENIHIESDEETRLFEGFINDLNDLKDKAGK